MRLEKNITVKLSGLKNLAKLSGKYAFKDFVIRIETSILQTLHQF